MPDRLKVSARGYHRGLRVARTLADLEGAANVARIHVIEAMSYGSIARMVILAVIAFVFSAGGWFAVVVWLGRGQTPNTGALAVTFFFTAAAYIALRALILRWRRRRTKSREPLP